MARDLVQELADFIGPLEGCADCRKDGLIYPYICPAGYPTQGYGLLVKDMKAPPITQEEALRRFKLAIPLYIEHALRLSPRLVQHPDALIAVTSFIFNLGPTAYAGSTLRRKVNAGDWQGAMSEIVKWNKATDKRTGLKVIMGGLTKRRLLEAGLISKEI